MDEQKFKDLEVLKDKEKYIIFYAYITDDGKLEVNMNSSSIPPLELYGFEKIYSDRTRDLVNQIINRQEEQQTQGDWNK